MVKKKDIDWGNLSFSYQVTDKRFVANYSGDKGAWDEGELISDDKIVMSEDAGVLQYSQSVFEGLKAYTTEAGHIVCFRPDLNAERMYDSALRLEMPPYPRDKFVEAVEKSCAAMKPGCLRMGVAPHYISVLICSVSAPSSESSRLMITSSEFSSHLWVRISKVAQNLSISRSLTMTEQLPAAQATSRPA